MEADDLTPSPPFASTTEFEQAGLWVEVSSDEEGGGEGEEGEQELASPQRTYFEHHELRTETPSPKRRPKKRDDLTFLGRTHWTDAHDEIMVSMIKKGKTWREISRSLGGRKGGFSDDAVRNRHTRLENSGRILPRPKRVRNAKAFVSRGPSWTQSEDELLVEAFQKYKHNLNRMLPLWDLVASACGPRRTASSARLRAQRLGILKYASAGA